MIAAASSAWQYTSKVLKSTAAVLFGWSTLGGSGTQKYRCCFVRLVHAGWVLVGAPGLSVRYPGK